MRFPTESMFKQQLSIISQGYEKLGQLYMQQATEKKLLANSDDPVLASRIGLTYDYLNDIDSYKQNGVIANNRAQLFDTSIKDAVNNLEQINQIIGRALSDTASDADRSAMAEQLKGFLKNLLNDANATDGNRDYIFGGYNTGTIPYALSNNKYQYQGGMNSTVINIGHNVSTLYNESGYSVFGNILDGNGAFTVKGASANTGVAYSSTGSVTNSSTYVRDTYTISFVTNGSGQLAYQVIGAASGQVIPPPPATIPTDAPAYTPDTDIGIPGMSLQFSGTPNAGDTFTVAPSQNQNIFDEIDNLVNILKTPVDNDPVKRAELHQKLAQSNDYFSHAYGQFVNYRSQVGVQMQVIENQKTINTNLMKQESIIYDELANVKLESVISELSQQITCLQAAQDCYKLIQASFMQMIKIF